MPPVGSSLESILTGEKRSHIVVVDGAGVGLERQELPLAGDIRGGLGEDLVVFLTAEELVVAAVGVPERGLDEEVLPVEGLGGGAATTSTSPAGASPPSTGSRPGPTGDAAAFRVAVEGQRLLNHVGLRLASEAGHWHFAIR